MDSVAVAARTGLASATTPLTHEGKKDIGAQLACSVLAFFATLCQGIAPLVVFFVSSLSSLAMVVLTTVPIVGTVINIIVSLIQSTLLITKMGQNRKSCQDQIKTAREQRNFIKLRELTLYLAVKQGEIIVQFVVLATSILAIGLLIFGSATFFLPAFIALVLTAFVLLIAIKMIDHVCGIKNIESKYFR